MKIIAAWHILWRITSIYSIFINPFEIHPWFLLLLKAKMPYQFHDCFFLTELNKIDEFIIKLVSMLISHSLRKWAAIAMKILSGSVKLYFFKWTNMGQQHYLIIFPRYCFSRFFISLLRWWHFARFMCIFSFVFIYVIALCCCLTRPFFHIA